MENEYESSNCSHVNVRHEGGYVVCQDCGLILEDLDFADSGSGTSDFPSDTQQDFEKKLKISNSKAKQDPVIKHKYDKIQMLDKWFRDYKTSFSEQKHTIEQLKTYEIGLEIDKARFQSIKKRYLRYNRKDKKTYQNMVIIFLALVWEEIKDTTNVRIEEYIRICSEDLGHKVNKKMLNNAMLKIKRSEEEWRHKKLMTREELESEIKNKIKILFQKNLNKIPFEKVKDQISDNEHFDALKIKMELKADELLNKISYDQIQNLNYKAFAAGLIYYIGQALHNRKIFTQNLIYEVTDFSSTTIRKKYKILRGILGEPIEN